MLIDFAAIPDLHATQRISTQLARVQDALDAEMHRRAVMQMVVVNGQQSVAALQAVLDGPDALTRRDEWGGPGQPGYGGAVYLDSFFAQDPVEANEPWCLPSITTNLLSQVARALSGLTVEQLRALASDVAKIQNVVMRLLQDLIEPPPHGLLEHHPPSSTSPCGVIRRATPRVPRAPGMPLLSDVFSQPLAVAA
ncbi:hypothetical protein OG897_34295 [Streptomyces sp. NBC_00237]|uniref:hypothetical protein n=1 Tax=Streptomyces sp. NBC_00237 TaxID=2975687 RepID=UPI002258F925|nr:hypothetical protein [Streptomyces sp. NBC_00237]MCX5206465.1 hypothetical protein [Streptomyces sp. NBC_00237]